MDLWNQQNLYYKVDDIEYYLWAEAKKSHIKDLNKLFTKFQRLDLEKNSATEGTGLGLVITKRLVNSMGGFIKVSSEYGKGSVFSFVIPLKVSDKSPFVSVKESEKINAACYIDVDKFKNLAEQNNIEFPNSVFSSSSSSEP